MRETMSVHVAAAGVFFAFGVGVGIGLWRGASGGILARSGVDAAKFGIILTVYTAADLVAMSAGGALGHRFGVRRVLAVSAIVFGAALCALLDTCAGIAGAGAHIASGFLGGVVDVTMNAEGARIERRLGKPILACLHAGLIAAIGLAAAGLAYDRTACGEPESPPRATALDPRGLSFAPALIGLGIVIGMSMGAETAASVWSTLLLRAEAPRLAAIAGLGAAFFSACQATLRFNADFIRLRFNDARIIVGSFAVAAAGLAVVAVERDFAASVAGFALIGVGTGAIVPCSFALAARQSAAQPAVGLSSASLFSALTRLPAPLVTAAIAQDFSIPAAFAPPGRSARAAKNM